MKSTLKQTLKEFNQEHLLRFENNATDAENSKETEQTERINTIMPDMWKVIPSKRQGYLLPFLYFLHTPERG